MVAPVGQAPPAVPVLIATPVRQVVPPSVALASPQVAARPGEVVPVQMSSTGAPVVVQAMQVESEDSSLARAAINKNDVDYATVGWGIVVTSFAVSCLSFLVCGPFAFTMLLCTTPFWMVVPFVFCTKPKEQRLRMSRTQFMASASVGCFLAIWLMVFLMVVFIFQASQDDD